MGGWGVEQKWKYSSAQLGPELGKRRQIKWEDDLKKEDDPKNYIDRNCVLS